MPSGCQKTAQTGQEAQTSEAQTKPSESQNAGRETEESKEEAPETGESLEETTEEETQAETGEEPLYEIVLATDIHYLAEDLAGSRCQSFINYVYGGDGRVLLYSWEILDAFIEDMKEKDPDLLLLSGDLTLNGEKASHEELAVLLEELDEEGITTLVIPGNHDINNPNAKKFSGTNSYPVDSITAEEFEDIYAEFGYVAADSRDPNSLSYLYKVDSSLWLLMLDSCQYDPENKIGGRIRKETLLWMEKWLERAREEQVMVIPVAHHNLLKESTLYPEDCTLENAVQVIDLLEQYGLPVYISGHLHLQRVKKHGNGGPSQAEESYGIYEIVSDSMVIPPCQYGELRWQEDGSVQYETCPVDVAGWAASQGITDENLLNFPQYSGDFLIETVQNQVYGALSAIPDDRKFHMAKLYGQINSAYCAGTAVNRRDVKENQMYFYWNRYLGTSEWYENLQAMIKDTGKDHNSLILQAGEDFPDRYKQEEIETAEKPADHTEKGEELR